jgi:glycosyltransferase involved in cell wall biosynthesis
VGDSVIDTPILFIVSALPHSSISVQGIAEGRESIDGTRGSMLLVADGLARRRRPVGVVVLDGSSLADTSLRIFHELDPAMAWARGGPVVWCSWADYATLKLFESSGVRPLMWLETHIDQEAVQLLKSGTIRGLVVPSDFCRLPFLHLSCQNRIGRVHNPLNPVFCDSDGVGTNRYYSQRVAFAGFMGETKGTHRVLEAWYHVRRRLPDATLTIAGSARLYGRGRSLGPLGLAEPQFEKRFLVPLVERYGSLECSGIELAGLLPASKLLELYRESALGVVNPNWSAATETFCCTGVEMLAAGTPVVSVARGALPETLGASGGAVLVSRPDVAGLADAIVELLQQPERLQTLAEAGRTFVRSHYSLERIVDHWQRILAAPVHDLSRLSGPWEYRPQRARYVAERLCGKLGLGQAVELARVVVRRVAR